MRCDIEGWLLGQRRNDSLRGLSTQKMREKPVNKKSGKAKEI